MSPEDRQLAAALREAEEDAVPAVDAPDPDALWAALHGELAAEQARDVVDAALRSPTGFEEVRLVAALAEELEDVEVETDAAPAAEQKGSNVMWFALAVGIAAAVLTMLALRGDPPPDPQPGPEYRGEKGMVEPLVPHGSALPASAFELAWEPVEDAASYDVRVSTADGRVLLQRRGLREPKVIVPASALAEVAAGVKILWQVEVLRGDGSRDRSATFSVTLQ